MRILETSGPLRPTRPRQATNSPAGSCQGTPARHSAFRQDLAIPKFVEFHRASWGHPPGGRRASCPGCVSSNFRGTQGNGPLMWGFGAYASRGFHQASHQDRILRALSLPRVPSYSSCPQPSFRRAPIAYPLSLRMRCLDLPAGKFCIASTQRDNAPWQRWPALRVPDPALYYTDLPLR